MDTSRKTKKKLNDLDRQREVLRAKRDKTMLGYILGPLLVAFASIATGIIPLIAIATFAAITISSLVYHSNFVAPFKELSKEVKESLLGEFMRIYHPNTDYLYSADKRQVENIIDRSGLISADRYKEEDVIIGSKGNVDFYLSEIHLQKKHKSKNKTSYSTIFKGLLFKIKLPGRSFPKSQLYSEPNMFKRLFGAAMKNENYGFWYETADQSKFESEMESLFPFIRHLSKTGEVRISTKGDEITILMESDMKFLDDPKPTLNRSFQNEDYYAKISQQVNSLLYIIDSFVDELSPLEIEENLKLRVLEYADKKLNR